MKPLISTTLILLLLVLAHCNEEEQLPPAKPELTSPANNDTGLDYDLSFSWKESEGAEKYDFQLSRVIDFSSAEIIKEGLTSPSLDIKDLDPATVYFWRVVAKNQAGLSPWSSTFKFTTRALNVPSLITPTENSIVSINNVKFEWSEITDADGYSLQISSKNDFSSLIVEQTDLSTNSFIQPQLLHATDYFWRVKSRKNNVSSDWSTTGKFKTEALTIPTLISPANNLTNSSRTIEFKWNTVTESDSYELQLSNESNFDNQIIAKVGLTTTSYSVTGLMFSTNYYWRVRAEKGGIKSEWSEIRKVTTESLGIPELQSPGDNAQLTSNTVEFKWSAVNEATYYNLQVSTTNDFTSLSIHKNGLTSLVFTSSTLKSNTKYYWRVNAQVENCQSEWSVIRNFTTPSVPLDGLVAWYPFNGNANDESGKGNNGTVFGASLSEDRFGLPNKAYSFDGINDYIKVTNPSALNFPDGVSFTVSFFYNPSSIVTNALGFNGIVSRFHNNLGPTSGWQIGRDANNLRFEATNPCGFNNLTSLTNGNWIHILQTYDRVNGQIKTYINGGLVNITECISIKSSMINTYDLKIGVEREGFQYSSGKIDDIAIYNRILTANEIQLISNN